MAKEGRRIIGWVVTLLEIEGEPRAWERDTLQAALDRAGRILRGISPFSTAVPAILDPSGEAWLVPLTLEGIDPCSTVAGEAVVALTAYAQRGEGLDDEVAECCISLIPIAPEALDEAGRPDPSTPLGLVVAAALAREKIERGFPISTTALAVFAGLSAGRIRQLVVGKEIEITEAGEVPASVAKRWLGARGVAGFGGRLP